MSESKFLTRRQVISLSALAVLSLCSGCSEQSVDVVRVYRERPPSQVIFSSATRIDDADTNSFDALMSSAFKRGDNIILIQTHQSDTNWSGRLAFWIDAWNQGPEIKTNKRDNYNDEFQYSKPPPAYAYPPFPAIDILFIIVSILDKLEKFIRNLFSFWQYQKELNKRKELLRYYLLDWFLDENSGEYYAVFYKTNVSENF